MTQNGNRGEPVDLHMDEREYLDEDEFPEGADCYVSRKVWDEGRRVGVMYRDTPCSETDTGWRLFAGEESEEYVRNPNNFTLCDVQAVSELDGGVDRCLYEHAYMVVYSRSSEDEDFDFEPETMWGGGLAPQRVKVILGLFLGGLLFTVVYAIYMVFAYAPPYRWLAELQVRMFGGHLPFVTWFVCFAVLVIGYIIVAYGLMSRVLAWLMPVPVGQGVDDEYPPVEWATIIEPYIKRLHADAPAAEAAPVQRRPRFMVAGWPGFVVPIVIGLGFFIFGLCKLVGAEDIGPMTRHTAAAFHAQPIPDAEHVAVTGHVLWDARVRVSQGNDPADDFVPVVPLDSPTQPPALFLKISELDSRYLDTDKLDGHVFEGIVNRWGLPQPVRPRFSEKGLTPAGRHVMIDVGATPQSEKSGGWFLIGMGGLMFVWGVGAWFRSYRKACRLQPIGQLEQRLPLRSLGWGTGGLLLGAVACIICGLAVLGESDDLGTISQHQIDDFYAESIPDAECIAVRGHLLWDARIQWVDQRMGNEYTHTYVPMVPAGESPQEAMLFLQLSPYEMKRLDMNGLDEHVFEGAIDRNGLPGAVRPKFRAAGVVPGSGHVVIKVGDTPGSRTSVGWALASIGYALILAGGANWFWQNRRTARVFRDSEMP